MWMQPVQPLPQLCAARADRGRWRVAVQGPRRQGWCGRTRIAEAPQPDISPQTAHRLDNRNYTGGGKESDEQEVTLCRRKTTTKRSQRRERGQLPHPWVHPRCLHLALDVATLGVVTQTASTHETQRKKK